MERNAALRRLPDNYATALRLRDQGQTPAAIADALGVDLSAIDTLLELADAKLSRLLRTEPADTRAPSLPKTGEPA